jgi:hypothetical protein
VKQTIAGHVKIQKNRGIISSPMDNETVMMSIEKGKYYGIDSIGTRIWELLDQPLSIDELCEILPAEYDVEPDQCRADVTGFVEKMLEKELVRLPDSQ